MSKIIPESNILVILRPDVVVNQMLKLS
jgi:hypothetical protein